MLYFTAKKDLKLLLEYHARMLVFIQTAEMTLERVRNYVDSKRLVEDFDRDVHGTWLQLQYNKSRVNEAAHRYACSPPWNDTLVRVASPLSYLNAGDAFEAKEYRGRMNFLLGRVEHTKEKELARLRNPLMWPALSLRWFFPQSGKLDDSKPPGWFARKFDKATDKMAEQLGLLIWVAGIIIVIVLWTQGTLSQAISLIIKHIPGYGGGG